MNGNMLSISVMAYCGIGLMDTLSIATVGVVLAIKVELIRIVFRFKTTVVFLIFAIFIQKVYSRGFYPKFTSNSICCFFVKHYSNKF